MNSIIQDTKAIGKLANLKSLEGRPQSVEVMKPVEIKQERLETLASFMAQDHTHTVTPADSFWAGPGRQWVQGASGKWVTESEDEFVRDAQGNVVMDFGFPMRKNKV